MMTRFIYCVIGSDKDTKTNLDIETVATSFYKLFFGKKLSKNNKIFGSLKNNVLICCIVYEAMLFLILIQTL